MTTDAKNRITGFGLLKSKHHREVVTAWSESGRTVFVRKMNGVVRISLNGGAYKPLADGIDRIDQFFAN
jgi:hypothetical protein